MRRSQAPNQLALSDNGQYLYVGLDGDKAIRRLVLPALTLDIQFTLPGSTPARRIAVMPGRAGTIAVSHQVEAGAPILYIAIYDDNLRRSNAWTTRSGCTLTFSADTTSLFSLDGGALFRLDVTQDGLANKVDLRDLGGACEMERVGSLLYTSWGHVVDTERLVRVSAYPPHAHAAGSSSSNLVYFSSYSAGVPRVIAYSTSTERPVWSFTLPANTPLTTLVRWGDEGLAVRTLGSDTVPSQLFVVSLANSHPLVIDKAGTGNGTVSSTPSRLTCGDACAALFPDGTGVTLSAAPDARSSFVRWDGDPDCADGVITMTAAKSCTAVFAPLHAGPIVTVPLRANALVYARSRGQLLAAISGLDPARGNTVTFLDPRTGELGPSIWVGGDCHAAQPLAGSRRGAHGCHADSRVSRRKAKALRYTCHECQAGRSRSRGASHPPHPNPLPRRTGERGSAAAPRSLQPHWPQDSRRRRSA